MRRRSSRIEIFDPFHFHALIESSIFPFRSSFISEHDEFDELSPFEVFDAVTNLETPPFNSYKRIQHRATAVPELYLQTISDRVSALESKFEQLAGSQKSRGYRRYTWTAEIKSPVERKYTWTAEIKGGKKEEKKKKHKVPVKRAPPPAKKIEETESEHGAVVLRQAFAKRGGALRAAKGKNKEVSRQDAALLIQTSFRAFMIRRLQANRALKELAIAKAKLKEIRALFNNFTYRSRVSRDAVERQRFAEKVIVLLLTVDSTEGADMMVRASKKAMVDELEAMLDVVDPQPAEGRSASMKRRTFDMPDGAVKKEIAEGVAQVVQMLQQEEEEKSFSASQ